jgi:hypothetical protein
MTGTSEKASPEWRTPCFGLRVRPKTAIFCIASLFCPGPGPFFTPAGVPDGRVSENAVLGAVFRAHEHIGAVTLFRFEYIFSLIRQIKQALL